MRSLMILPFMLLLWTSWTFGDNTTKATNSPPILEDACEQDEDFNVNEEVYLYCYFISKQPFDVIWYKDDHEIQPKTSARYHFTENNQVLSIPKAWMSDQGKYRCKGLNKYGETSHNITVTMHLSPCGRKAPKVYSPLPTLTVKKGQRVTLICVVMFQNCQATLPTFEWRNSKGHLVRKATKTKVVANTGGTLRIMRLTKKSVKKRDSGIYKCGVNSARTKTTSKVKVIVVDF